MITYLVKAARKPLKLSDKCEPHVTFDFMKEAVKGGFLPSGSCLQFINDEDELAANKVEIGCLKFGGVNIIEQWGGI